MQPFTIRGAVLAVATALQLAAAAAVAQTPAGQSTLQPYVGVAVGSSRFDIDTTGAARADTSSTGYKLFGGVQFNQHFGFEAAAFDLGKATGGVRAPGLGALSVEGKVRGVSLAGTAALPLSDAAALYAKAGIAFVETRATVGTPLGSFSEDDSSAQPVFGLGARWNFTETIAARLEWERVRARFLDDEKVDTDLVSVGLQYRF